MRDLVQESSIYFKPIIPDLSNSVEAMNNRATKFFDFMKCVSFAIIAFETTGYNIKTY